MVKHRANVTRLPPVGPKYKRVAEQFNSSIVPHRGNYGGRFSRYNIVEICQVRHPFLWGQYVKRRQQIKLQNGRNPNERLLFHGTPAINFVDGGFDMQFANPSGMFGPGIYFAEHSSKSNQYVLRSSGCAAHNNKNCYLCVRAMLLCRVTLGNSFNTKTVLKQLPPGSHSVTAAAAPGFLEYPEYVVYQENQVFPEYLIVYKIVP